MPEGAGGASSPSYRIFETRQFLRDLAKLGQVAQRRLEARLREHVYTQRRQEPHWGQNIRRLANWELPTWRYRIGDWRFFYEIDEKSKTVFMTVADHRKQAYR